MKHYKFAALYFLMIVFVNIAYGRFGEYIIWNTPWPGTTWSPLALIVGCWFILRDYAQGELGWRVLLVMAAGMVVSYIAAGPQLAIASATAFAISELIDFAIFTFSKRPFAQRVLISSLAAAPVDTVIFFAMADFVDLVPGVKTLSWPTVLTETVSKLLAAAYIYHRLRKGSATPISAQNLHG